MPYVRPDQLEDYIDKGESSTTPLPGSDVLESTGTIGTDVKSPPTVQGIPVPQGQPTQMPAPVGPTGRTLSDLSGFVGRLGTQLDETSGEFYDLAGESREWGVPFQEDITQAVAGGAEEDLDRAMGYLTAGYEGPEGLPEETIAPMEVEISDYLAATGPAREGNVSTWLSQAYPTLTPGEAQFEARRRGGEVRREALDFGGEARRALAEIDAAREAAQSYAVQRGEEERGIAAGALEAVTGMRGERETALEGRAAEAQAQYDAFVDAWDQYQRTGDIEHLMPHATPEQARALQHIRNTPVERREEANRAYEQIINDSRWREISEIPVGELRITPEGYEGIFFTIGGEDYDLDQMLRGEVKFPGKTTEETQRIAGILQQRQMELERMFSPVTTRTQGVADWGSPESRAAAEEVFSQQGGRGTYADVRPMYASELMLPAPWEAPSIFDLTSHTMPEGTPSMSTVATPEEAAELERIYELLGSGESPMSWGGYEAPSLSVDPQQVRAYNEQLYSDYLAGLESLMRAEQQQREEVINRRRQDVMDTPWGTIEGLAGVPIFTVPALIAGFSHEGVSAEEAQRVEDRIGRDTGASAAEALARYYGVRGPPPPAQRTERMGPP